MSRSSADVQRLLIERDAIRVKNGGAARRMGFEWSPDAALKALAAEPGGNVRRGARWEVLFADTLARYLVIQWPTGLRGGPEREAFVAHRFREVHGVAAPEWRIAVERTATGIAALACAVPALHVDAVAGWARGSRLRLSSVTGEFIAAYNRVRPQLEHSFGALAVQREGRVTVGLWCDAIWQTVRSQPVGPAGDASLGLYLEAQDLRLGTRAEGGVLYCLGAGFDAPPGWRTVTLETDTWG